MSHLTQILASQEALRWKRPSDWLAFPVSREAQRRGLIGLVAVSPRPTSLGFIVSGVAYTVDWGDGIVEHYGPGDHATHVYTFARLPASTYTSRGYRQAIVTVSWEAAGNNGLPIATGLEVTDYTAINDITRNTTPLLDLQIAARTVSQLVISPVNKPSRMCEQVWLRPMGPVLRWNTYSQGLFENMNALQAVPDLQLGTLTNLDRAFRNCTNLRVPPRFDESLVESMEELFAGCTSLISVGMQAPKCKNFARAFLNCTSLQEVVIEGSAGVENWQEAFKGCTSMPHFHQHELNSAQDLSGMFEGCTGLLETEDFIAPVCKTTDNMFRGCSQLRRLGRFEMPQNLNIIGMFQSCWSLVELPWLGFGELLYVSAAFADMYALQSPPQGFDTPGCIEFSSMFANCVNLLRAPELRTAKGRSFNAVFQNCTMLEAVPPWDMSGVTNASGLSQAFENLRSCQRVLVQGLQATVSFRGLPLGAAQLNEIFDNLRVVQGNSRVVTISGALGALQDELRTELATAKGWDVAA